MKVSIQGSTGTILCQTQAVRAGFAELGHQHVDNPRDPDVSFVFVGNSPHTDYLDLTKEKKTIFNVLDVCPHCVEHPEILLRLRQQLPQAGRVTTISKTVAAQMRDLIGIEADVIYYPMKPVRHTGEKKHSQFRALACGRINDPNKYYHAAVQALVRAGFEEHEVAVVGYDRPAWGTWLGPVSDEALNNLFNSVDYVIALSKEEGILLPPIEGACCGAIPIVAAHLSTLQEFWVQSPLGLHYQTLTSPAKVAELIMSLEKNQDWKTQVKQDMLGYAELAFRPKFTPRNVAARIIEVAHTI